MAEGCCMPLFQGASSKGKASTRGAVHNNVRSLPMMMLSVEVRVSARGTASETVDAKLDRCKDSANARGHLAVSSGP